MGCTHSVVYYSSPLWWQESARDHADALLSLKYPPTVYISDIAGRVARHTNNRTQQTFFQPHDGRLCAPTEQNIKDANTLHLTFPWINKLRLKSGIPQQDGENQDWLSRAHPETGTKDRFSLYDRFHQRNQRRPEEKLRSLDLLPDLACLVNSSSAEQINRGLSATRYSLCQMKDTHFMFSLRLHFHLHNKKINKKFKMAMQSRTKEVMEIGVNGRLALKTEGICTPYKK